MIYDKRIGNGQFTEVWSAAWQKEEGARQVAIKFLIEPERKREFLKTHYFLKYLNLDAKSHPFFIQNFGIATTTQGIGIVTDCADISVHDFLKAAEGLNGFSLENIRKIVKSVAEALVFLENEKIIYPNLTPKKILLFGNQAKLGCFNKSYFEYDPPSAEIDSGPYSDPVVLAGYLPDFKSPIWSLAQIAKEMFTKTIYLSASKRQILSSFRSLVTTSIPDWIKDLKIYQESLLIMPIEIENLIPLIRRTSKGKQEDLGLTESFLDLLLKMLQYENPISAEEILRHPFVKENPSDFCLIPKKTELNGYFDPLKNLGKGTFGTVYSALLKENGDIKDIFAIKTAHTINGEIDRSGVRSILKEDRFLKLLARNPESAPYIVKREAFFRCNDQVHLVLEFALSNLKQYREKIRDFSVYDLKKIAKHLFEALDFLYRNEIMHLDIKPANILIREDDTPVLADFGGSCFHQETSFLSTKIGTQEYRSPEIALEISPTSTADVWSLGATLIKVLLKVGAFVARDGEDLIRLQKERLGPFPESLLKNGSEKKQECYQKIDPSSSHRSLSKFIKSTYVKDEDIESFIDFVSKALTLDPNQRPSARDLLAHSFLQNENVP